MIAGIFLAAGRGKRFGADKLLYEIRGHPLVYYALRACVDSQLSTIFVVVEVGNRRLRTAIETAFSDGKKINILENPRAFTGMTSSLKTGLKAAGSHDGAMICLGDMPFVTSEIIDTLLHRYAKGKIVIPVCEKVRRHPRILPADLIPEFMSLENSQKGSSVIERHSDRVVEVKIGQVNNFLDIDRVSDLDHFPPI